ncbi:MAG: uracil-DNA glycosylase [Campylobacterota bacterium]|nr:uracil-DNA glycosylase [Campylobacterota bacterium]
MNTKIICQKCKFYFVTWEQGKPHGCKAYGFKSAQIPSSVVKQSSGMQCGYYTPKKSTD